MDTPSRDEALTLSPIGHLRPFPALRNYGVKSKPLGLHVTTKHLRRNGTVAQQPELMWSWVINHEPAYPAENGLPPPFMEETAAIYERSNIESRHTLCFVPLGDALWPITVCRVVTRACLKRHLEAQVIVKGQQLLSCV